MAGTSLRRLSSTRLVVALTVMGGLAAGLVAPAGNAVAPSKKLVHVTLDIKDSTDTTTVQTGITGKSAPLAASTTYVFHFSLQNDAHSPQAFGSFEIAVPAGFSIGAPSVTDNGGAAVNTLSDLSGTGAGPILLTTSGPTGSGVQPSSTFSFRVPVTSPASAGCNTTWTTGVKQSNDFSGSGNDFNTNSPSTPLAGSDHLSWTTQPVDVQVNTTMAASSVTVLDACGNLDTSLDPLAVTATDVSSDPTHPAPITVNTSSGVATFSTVSYTTYGYDHTLHATSSAVQDCASGGNCYSSSFHVYQVLTPCSTNGKTACTANNVFDGANTTGISVNGGADTSPATLTIDVGAPGVDLGNCNQPAGVPLEPPIGTVVSLNIGTRTKTGVLEITKNFFNQNPNNGTPFMDICLDVPSTTTPTFQDKFGQTVPRLVNNVWITSGLLQDCSTLVGPPCVSNRKKNAGNEFISFTLPAGDPHLGGF